MNHKNHKLNKYKLGDKVVTSYNSVYTIYKVYRKQGIWEYECLDYKDEVFVFQEDVLKFHYEDPKPGRDVSPDDIPSKCPICSSEWKRTPYGYGKAWLDCTKCNLTAEEAVARSRITRRPWDW
jgi:hypothetical protein